MCGAGDCWRHRLRVEPEFIGADEARRHRAEVVGGLLRVISRQCANVNLLEVAESSNSVQVSGGSTAAFASRSLLT